jgi:uncharacterized protein (TIGR02147 family)
MKLSVFEYKNYKRFIRDWMEQAPQQGRGMRKQLAEALGCQMAFITHVLSGDYHFSAEQAEACGRWMGMDEEESDFFLLMVLYERAGTKGLQNLLRRQISEKREKQAILKKRVNITETLSLEDQLIYYSSWHYAALHMAILNPGLRTVEALQKHFQLPAVKIMKVLEFLLTKGFVAKEKDRLKVIKPVLHLEHNSPLLTQHHSHWRLKALESIGSKNHENLHYSGVMSLSNEDFEWVREKLSLLLKEVVGRLANSPDEKLACLNFDWFQI